jgi:hypothetical protein
MPLTTAMSQAMTTTNPDLSQEKRYRAGSNTIVYERY